MEAGVDVVGPSPAINSQMALRLSLLFGGAERARAGGGNRQGNRRHHRFHVLHGFLREPDVASLVTRHMVTQRGPGGKVAASFNPLSMGVPSWWDRCLAAQQAAVPVIGYRPFGGPAHALGRQQSRGSIIKIKPLVRRPQVEDHHAQFPCAASRATSLAALSSRRPLKDPWRSSPSAVQPRNSTSQTSFGSVQRTPFSAPVGSRLPNAGFGACSLSIVTRSDRESSWDHPVPTRPA